jgi:hypothetical protein
VIEHQEERELSFGCSWKSDLRAKSGVHAQTPRNVISRGSVPNFDHTSQSTAAYT